MPAKGDWDVLRFIGSDSPGDAACCGSQVSQNVENLRVVNLRTLIELKLAARRFQDFADVVSLIRANGLEESFAEQLHPSVRADFIDCLEEKRRDDAYERR